ncbi:MAG: oxidoreductase [Candidatus Latescibacterota bacterium]|nr:oxidoreductase [Candidatus Latescibacterota bacterium]
MAEAPVAAHAPRRKVREMQVKLVDVRMETEDTATLFLDVGDGNRNYTAGQFLTVDPHQFGVLENLIAYLEDIKGSKEKPRAYSMGSAPHEPYVMITVKEERYWPGESKYPPVLSPLLTFHTPVGSELVISGFTGPYTIPEDITDRTDNILHVCAGSGIVPNLALMKHSLHVGDGLRHVLLYSNRYKKDIIYYADFAKLARQFSDKVEIVHCITREDPVDVEPVARRGRIDRDLLQKYIPDSSNCMAYCCGPGVLPWEKKEAREKGETPEPKFVENMVSLLYEFGLDKKQVKQESWG